MVYLDKSIACKRNLAEQLSSYVHIFRLVTASEHDLLSVHSATSCLNVADGMGGPKTYPPSLIGAPGTAVVHV